MANLMDASRQWATRPNDERFISLLDLQSHVDQAYSNSRATVVPTRAIKAAPVAGIDGGLAFLGPDGATVTPTHWAFGQVAQRAGAPAGYLRTLPAPIAADALNYGLATREVEDVGVLLRKNGVTTLAAMTGPAYGRVWNRDIVKGLVDRFGDGVTGHFRVPGEFGKRVEITKANTTLYASDRDLFVFLADEDRRIEIPNRRDGKSGSLARGFFVWNSEVGKTTFGVKSFLFDYACCNRIVWGAEDVKEFKIRHTSQAPRRWIEEVAPAIEMYAKSSTANIVAAIEAAQAKKIGDADAVTKLLAERFTKSQVAAIQAAHLADEGRPIETLWDATTGVTAFARSVPFMDERVEIETAGGDLLNLAA
jgi:hypothetical protein